MALYKLNIYYKTDFKLLISREAGWDGTPFRLKFWTSTPAKALEASFDGTDYHNCHIHEDGRLCVAFGEHGMGLGKLRIETEFSVQDECYPGGVQEQKESPRTLVIEFKKHDPIMGVVVVKSDLTLSTSGDAEVPTELDANFDERYD